MQRRPSEDSIKKEPADRRGDELRHEYDLSRLQGGVRGKYYRQATAGTRLVLIEPDVAGLFPDSEAVNRVLRVSADATRVATTSKRRRFR